MTTEAIELKPCPFCGGDAEIVEVEAPNSGVVVECSGCHASGPLVVPVKEDGRPHAAFSWNRRIEPIRGWK